jgi:hypothetical protein
MELEDKILEMVNEITGAKYTGRVTVEEDDGIWILKLSPTKEFSMLTLGYEGDENGFISFVNKELRKRKLNRGSAKITLINGNSFEHKPVIEL